MTYNFIVGVVLVKVHTTNIHGRVGRRCGDNDLLGTTLQVSRGPKREKKFRTCVAFTATLNTYFSVVVKTP
jgi:hypothetical protein